MGKVRQGEISDGGGGGMAGKWMPGVVASAAVWVALLGLAMAWAAAAARLAQTAGEWSGWELAGGGMAIGWTGLCAWGLGVRGRRWSDGVFVAVASGMVLAVGLTWAWTTRGMGRWPMDSGMFRLFLARLSEGGWTEGTLRGLTGGYDYGAWAARSWPLYYPLRRWAGAEQFGLAVQICQSLLATAGVPVAWRTAKLLCGGKAARWATVGLVSMPGWTLQVVGLNHQVVGTFGYLASMWLLSEWMFGGGGAKKKTLVFAGACCAGGTVCFEGSAWSLYVLSAVALLGFELVRRGGRRPTALIAMAAMVAAPVGMARTVERTVLAPARAANPESMNGGSLAFAARGWDLQWMGEYSDTLQTLDILTPRQEKQRFFLGYLASQTAWNGRELVGKLFPAKLAKFMLAGYASLAEEVLWANGAEGAARVARGARTGWFLLLYAPLALWGLRKLAAHAEKDPEGWKVAWVAVPVALFAVAVVFAGETSPRYSMPVQALLMAAAGWGWSERHLRGRHYAGFAGGVLVAAAYVGVIAVVLGGRGLWARWALADMREARVLADGGGTIPATPHEVVFRGGRGVVEWPGLGGAAFAYLRGESWKERTRAFVEWGAGKGCEVELPARVEVDWGAGGHRRLSVQRVGSEGTVAVGYVLSGSGLDPTWKKSGVESGQGLFIWTGNSGE